jgi:hypothetical protein
MHDNFQIPHALAKHCSVPALECSGFRAWSSSALMAAEETANVSIVLGSHYGTNFYANWE